jgi:hypothetical protein
MRARAATGDRGVFFSAPVAESLGPTPSRSRGGRYAGGLFNALGSSSLLASKNTQNEQLESAGNFKNCSWAQFQSVQRLANIVPTAL